MSESVKEVLERAKITIDGALRAAEEKGTADKAVMESLVQTPAQRAMAEGNSGCDSGCTTNSVCGGG